MYKIYIIILLLTLSSCSYSCGDFQNDARKDPLGAVLDVGNYPFLLGESIICPQ